MKLIIFGTGLFYKNRKKEFPKNIEIVAFLDNNRELWGKMVDQVPVIAPKDVIYCLFDKILLMSKSSCEMRQQLLELGVDLESIMTWYEFSKNLQHGKFHFFCGNEIQGTKERILIVSTPLGYTGAPVAAIFAAKALQQRGYNVVICAEDGEKGFIYEIVEDGINIMLCPAIPFLGKEELFWIRQFDIVLVNTFLLISCACEISVQVPVVWWLHECSAKFENYYSDTINMFKNYFNKIMEYPMCIAGVSPIARNNFKEHFPKKEVCVLSYGIPDTGGLQKQKVIGEKRLVFAVIGTICKRKGQREFLEAVKRLDENEREKAEFWIIGASADKEYMKDVASIAEEYKSVKLKGELSRAEMEKAYSQIDIVVCSSLEETMSLVLTEGMMHGKVCITTNSTGMADYFIDGMNGFICEAGNVNSLKRCIKRVFENRGQLDDIRKKARETYEKYFTLEPFAERLEKTMFQAKALFESNC